MVPPNPLVRSTSAPVVTKSHLPPSASLKKSEDMAVTGPVDKPSPPPSGCTGIMVSSTRSTPSISARQTSKTTASSAKVSEDPFLLIRGQSQDYLVEITSSRETSPAGSKASPWINLDSDSSEKGGSGSNVSQNISMQEKLRHLEKSVASLQPQLQAPPSTTPKVTTFNAIVELIRDNIPTEILVKTTISSEKREGEGLGVFEPQADPIQQLPWHENAVRAFEACANEVSHPSTQSERMNPPSGWGRILNLESFRKQDAPSLRQKVHLQPCTLAG